MSKMSNPNPKSNLGIGPRKEPYKRKEYPSLCRRMRV